MNLADLFIAKKLAGGGGGGTGTDNYNDLSNKPQINSTALTGNKSASDLGLQSEIDGDNKISADYVDDTNTSNKFVSAADKLAWSGKQDAIDADHKLDANYVDDTTSTNKFVTASDKAAWDAKQNAIDSSHKLSSDLVDDTGHTNLFVTSTEKSIWSGKQDKIDSSHKLSSTLVSFDSAEAAALASGIDSAKVSQISTNQTNILYGLQTGVKNIIQLNPGTYKDNVATFTVSNDGEVIINSGSAGTSATSIGEFELPAGDYVYWYDGTAATGKGDVRLMNGSTRLPSQFTLSAATTIRADVYSYAVNSNISIKPMLCTAAAWAQEPNVYRKPAVSNSDLTQLQSEDRAELVELVDNGDKNIFPIQTLVPYGPGLSNNSNLTCTNNGDGTYTLNGSTTAAGAIHLCDTMYSNTYGGYYMSGCPRGLNSASEEKARLALYTAVGSSGVAYETGNGVLLPSTFNQCYLAIYVFANKTFNNVVFKPMFCTKAKYIISPKYVQHVENKTYKGIGIVDSGSLNSITESCFAAYSNNVTDGPVANQWMFCRTTILDAPSALQEVTTIGAGFESYIRVKSNSEWKAWKKITTTTL